MLRIAMRLAFGAVGLVLALGIVIHLPPIKHWLGAHGHHGAGVCPLGYGQTTRVAIAAPRDGVARPALGFTLGVTTAAEIERWGIVHGIACSERRGQVTCENVPSTLLGDVAAPAASLSFSLDGTNAVRSIQVTRRGAEARAITAAYNALARELAITSGAPTKQSGSADPSDLARGALRQAMVEYRAREYRAVLRATNMGDGYVLTEQYALVN